MHGNGPKPVQIHWEGHRCGCLWEDVKEFVAIFKYHSRFSDHTGRINYILPSSHPSNCKYIHSLPSLIQRDIRCKLQMCSLRMQMQIRMRLFGSVSVLQNSVLPGKTLILFLNVELWIQSWFLFSYHGFMPAGRPCARTERASGSGNFQSIPVLRISADYFPSLGLIFYTWWNKTHTSLREISQLKNSVILWNAKIILFGFRQTQIPMIFNIILQAEHITK